MATNLKLSFKGVWALGAMAFMVPVGGTAVAQERAAAGSAEGKPSTAQRLTRIQVEDESGEKNPDATIGQRLVTAYGGVWKKTQNGTKPLPDYYRHVLCTGPNASILSYATNKSYAVMSKQERKLVKKGDMSTLIKLATSTVAEMDGHSADLILADEALGPGVYNAPVNGTAYVIKFCGLL